MSPELVIVIEQYQNSNIINYEKSNIFSLGLILLRMILILED